MFRNTPANIFLYQVRDWRKSPLPRLNDWFFQVMEIPFPKKAVYVWYAKGLKNFFR